MEYGKPSETTTKKYDEKLRGFHGKIKNLRTLIRRKRNSEGT